ncbi:MAG: ribonuclease R [Alphaproteobacteria bacterium]
MAKKPKSKKPSEGFPTREQVVAFILESDKPVGKREIGRHFGIKGNQRIELKALLRELEREGDIDRGKSRKLAPKGALPEVAVLRVSGRNDDGDLVAEATGDNAAIDAEIIVVPSGRRTTPPKDGDRVLARLKRTGGNSYEASPIRILKPGPETVLAVAQRIGKHWRLASTDRKNDREYRFTGPVSETLADGDLVLIRPHSAGPARSGNRDNDADFIERIGRLDEPKSFSLIAIHQNGIPVDFPDAAQTEADRLQAAGMESFREDLRSLPLVTIDGADARDFDDAVHAEKDTSDGNAGGFVLTVAIADVAYYVRPGSPLDKAAQVRGNSCYFPDRVVPMLPERLSNDLCSLRPDEDRACLAVRMRIDARGKLLGHRFSRALMRSAARLTYEQVQAARNGIVDDRMEPLTETVIAPLYEAFALLDEARKRRGTLDLDLPEKQVVIGENGKVAEIIPRERLDSHRLIEEFMILANVAAAEALEKKRRPVMYRIHESPPLDKLEGLRETLASLGYGLAKGAVMKPALLTGILHQASGSTSAQIVSQIILRAQAQAVYAPENLGHFGLSLPKYAHFTSPIRRYADLLVHRSLIEAFGLGPGGLTPDQATAFPELGETISSTERRAIAAERNAMERYLTAYMSDRIGHEYKARITGAQRFGLFVSIDGIGAEGLVPIETLLPSDYYRHDEVHHRLVGDKTGHAYTLGDPVDVRLAEANTITGSLQFTVLSGGRVLSSKERKATADQIRKARRGGGNKPFRRYGARSGKGR